MRVSPHHHKASAKETMLRSRSSCRRSRHQTDASAKDVCMVVIVIAHGLKCQMVSERIESVLYGLISKYHLCHSHLLNREEVESKGSARPQQMFRVTLPSRMSANIIRMFHPEGVAPEELVVKRKQRSIRSLGSPNGE